MRQIKKISEDSILRTLILGISRENMDDFETITLFFRTSKRSDVVAHTCNPSTLDVDTNGS